MQWNFTETAYHRDILVIDGHRDGAFVLLTPATEAAFNISTWY